MFLTITGINDESKSQNCLDYYVNFFAVWYGVVFSPRSFMEQSLKRKPSQPADKSSESIQEKVKSLDLNDKQRKFLESLIESNKKD